MLLRAKPMRSAYDWRSAQNRMNIAGLVMRGAFVQVCIGLALGIPCVIALAKALSSSLYHVALLDPSALAIAVGSLLIGAFIASIVPAYRAARIDPIPMSMPRQPPGLQLIDIPG